MSLQTPSPYKFLDSYGVADGDRFFGRDPEINILLADIVTARLVVLFAPTGTGKTSLINAGVRPALGERGYETFYVRVEKDPVASARAVVGAEHPEMRSDDTSFASQLRGLAERLQRPIVLFFDQFEEFFLFVANREPARAQAFVAAIAEVYDDEESGVHVVFSMREEFFVELELFRDLIPAIYHADSNLRLRHFRQDQARAAIIGPARSVGVTIDDEVVATIVSDLALSPDFGLGGLVEPAQLQIVCDALWPGAADGVIDVADYRSVVRQEVGTNIAHAILHQRVGQALEVVEDERELNLAAKLLPMLRTDRHTKWIHDVADLTVMLKANVQPLGRLLDRLVASRIVEVVIRDGMHAVGLTHDYLVAHLDELVRKIQAIWPQRMLRRALERYESSGAPAERAELDAIANGIDYLDIGRGSEEIRESAAVLFGFALTAAGDGRPFLDYALTRGHDVSSLFADIVRSDNALEIARAAPLLGYAVEAHPPSRVAALGLLQTMLDDDRQSSFAQDPLRALVTSADTRVAESARSLLFAFAAKAIATNRVTHEVLTALQEVATPTSVELLARELGNESPALSDAARRALQRLADGREPDVAGQAGAALAGAPARVVDGPSRSAGRKPGATDRSYVPSEGDKRALDVVAEAISREQCILVLGPGVHAPPPPGHALHYPSALRPLSPRQLSLRLATESDYGVQYPEGDPGDLQRVALCYEINGSRARLVDAITRAVDEGKAPSPMLSALAALPLPLVLTTNYDRLFERALVEAGKRPRSAVYDPESVPTTDHDDPTTASPVLRKLHGDISHRASLVVTDEDYIQFVLRMSDKDPYDPVPLSVKHFLTRWTTLFIGYNLMDYNLRLLFKTLRWRIDPVRVPDTYVLDPRPDPLMLDVWQSQRRMVRFIAADLWTFVPRLYEAVTGLSLEP